MSTETNAPLTVVNENVSTDFRQHKLNQKPSNARVPLKAISTNISRVQPFRAAKQNTTKEGFFNSQSCSGSNKQSDSLQSFKIFDESIGDHESLKQKSEKTKTISKVHIDSAVTNLPLLRLPLNTLRKHDTPSSTQGSPLVMDVSEEERLNIFDIDNEECTSGFSDYAVEIFEHLREAELLHRPKHNYMRKQSDITAGMRSILVDWLIEVGEEYRLHNETAHLAINYIDRFLSQMAVLKGKLQLVGTAAMFLAAKFEEIYPPDVGEFVYITDDTYTKKQVLRMEHLILKVLNFNIAVPTSNQFLKRFLKAAKADKKTECMAQYLCELALLDIDCIHYLPSTLAASAVCLASFTVSEKIWDDTMEFYMKYTLEDLVPCIKKLHSIITTADTLAQQAIPEKYKDAKYDCVATLSIPATLPFDNADKDESFDS